MKHLSNTLIKLATELIKHQAKQHFGEGSINVLAAGLVDYLGEDVSAKINNFLTGNENDRNLLLAFEDADQACLHHDDLLLKQMIFSKPLGKIETLERLARNMPKTLDSEGLKQALLHQFQTDWPNEAFQIHTKAALQYQVFLERALAVRCSQLLPTIFTKVERIEANTRDSLALQQEMKQKLDSIDNLVQEALLQKRNTTVDKFVVYGVPELPLNWLPREKDIEQVLELFKKNQGMKVAITGHSLNVGFLGMGGVGKSVLAASIAHRPEMRELFSDGVYWIALGQKLDEDQILSKLNSLGKRLGDPNHPYGDIAEANASLNEVFKNKKCLIVVDDIWDKKHARPFNFYQNQGCLLLTSRNKEAMEAFGARIHSLDMLTDDDSLTLLKKWAGYDETEPMLPEEKVLAGEIVKECGHLPLALAMAGGLVKDYDWNYVLYRLKNSELEEFSDKSMYDHPTLFRAIQVSIENLPDGLDKLYFDLAIFPDDTPVPMTVLKTLWANPESNNERNEIEAQKAITTLANRSLLHKGQNNEILIHDLLFDFIRKGANLEQLHRKLVHAYQRICPAGWHTGPDDGYFINHIAWHLTRAGFKDTLQQLLCDYRWLKFKVFGDEINSLIGEYGLLESQENGLWLVKDALQLSRHILSKDMHQLPSQLIGRLSAFAHENIQTLLSAVVAENQFQWIKPLTPSLTRPGTGELMTLTGHEYGVRSVATLPGGELAVSAAEDKALIIWNLASGKVVKKFQLEKPGKRYPDERGSYISALLIANDQKSVISAMYDHTIKIWDLESGQLKSTFSGHTKRVYSLAMTKDGTKLLSGSGDNSIRIWELSTGKCLKEIQTHTKPVRSIVLDQHDELFFTAGEDGYINVWNLEKMMLISSKQVIDSLRSLTYLDNAGDVFYAGIDGTLSAWNLTTGASRLIENAHTNMVRCIKKVIHNQKEYVISASQDRSIKIWNPDDLSCVFHFSGHVDSVNCLDGIPANSNNLGNESTYIISGSEDGTLKIWDLEIKALQEATIFHQEVEQHNGPVKILKLVAGNTKVASAGQDGIVKLWNLDRPQYIGELAKHKKAINALEVSADGNILFSAGNDQKVLGWSIEQDEVLYSYKFYTKIHALKLLPDGKNLAVGLDWNDIEVISLETELSQTLEGHGGPVYLLETTPNGKYLISSARGHEDNSVQIWDIRRQTGIYNIEPHRRFVTALMVTPDSQKLVTGLWNGKIKIWGISNGEFIQTFVGHNESVHSLSITPDGKWLISGSWDRTIRCWDIETGECVQVLSEHLEKITAVLALPDNKHLISASNDKSLKIWDISTGKCRVTFWADFPIYALCNTSGDVIVAGDQLGKVHFLQPIYS